MVLFSKIKPLKSIFFLSHFQRKWYQEFLHKWPPNLTYFRWSRGPKSIRPLWTVLPALVSRGRWIRNWEGVRFLGGGGSWTSNCSNFAATGPYSCGFHSRNNDDQYFTNLSQISKIHVDFRVICRHHPDNTSHIPEAVELGAGTENRHEFFKLSRETARIVEIENRCLELNWRSGTSYFKFK